MVRAAGLSMRAASVASGRSPEWLSATLARGTSPTLPVVASLAEPCGYALALVPVGDVPPSAIVIDAVRARDSRDSRGAGGA